MSPLAWTMNAAVALAILGFILAKWSVFKMAQQLNRSVEPGKRISLKWWPGYKGRFVLRAYHRRLPRGHLNFVYISSLGGALLILISAVVVAARMQH